MPPKKPDVSKKTVQKQKQKVIEDKTFGLKNKNKSKKVQQHINSIEKNVMNSGDPKLRKLEEQRKQARAEAKLRKKALQDEQEALFGEALLAVQKKNKGTNLAEGKIEAKGRDGNDDGPSKNKTSAAMKMMYQMDAQEMDDKLKEDPNYVPTVEDEIERERQKVLTILKEQKKVGTPITPETFAIWQEKKKALRLAEIQKRVETELRKKKGGKGLSVLSGKDLYEYKKELFNKFDENDDEPEEGPTGTTPYISRQSSTINNNDTTATTSMNGATSSSTTNGGTTSSNATVDAVASKLQSDLFLQGDNIDDLDDLEDD